MVGEKLNTTPDINKRISSNNYLLENSTFNMIRIYSLNLAIRFSNGFIESNKYLYYAHG